MILPSALIIRALLPALGAVFLRSKTRRTNGRGLYDGHSLQLESNKKALVNYLSHVVRVRVGHDDVN